MVASVPAPDRVFNAADRRTGTLWEGRFNSCVAGAGNYLLICQRYIELNPVRSKGMVDHPSEYPWSSYGYNALSDVDPLITQHEE